MSRPYALERQLALSAVRRACALTSSVFNKLVKNETLTKGDKSPVTGIRRIDPRRLQLICL
jgi:3'(2'), 5'-bisphosphate nucleotidase